MLDNGGPYFLRRWTYTCRSKTEFDLEKAEDLNEMVQAMKVGKGLERELKVLKLFDQRAPKRTRKGSARPKVHRPRRAPDFAGDSD